MRNVERDQLVRVVSVPSPEGALGAQPDSHSLKRESRRFFNEFFGIKIVWLPPVLDCLLNLKESVSEAGTFCLLS